MAKRFTDTNIWDKQWFRLLSPKMKEVWRYLCEKCNHAGIWELDLDTMSHFINEPVSLEDLKTHLGTKLTFVSNDKIFVNGFIEFQYKCSVKDLNPANKVHFSVINILRKLGLDKPLVSPLHGDKEQEQDKDQDKDRKPALIQNNSPARFELTLNREFKEFEKALLEELGFTPQFRAFLPDIYLRWKDHIPALVEFIDGRKAAAEKLELGGIEHKQAWIRRALVSESNLGGVGKNAV